MFAIFKELKTKSDYLKDELERLDRNQLLQEAADKIIAAADACDDESASRSLGLLQAAYIVASLKTEKAEDEN